MQEIPRAEANALVKLINSTTLLNKQLSAICQLNGLTSSGVKAHLQSRIANRELLLPLGNRDTAHVARTCTSGRLPTLLEKCCSECPGGSAWPPMGGFRLNRYQGYPPVQS